MSFRAVTLQAVELPGKGCPLAEIKGDDVWLWPAGVGIGTSLTFSKADWARIMVEVRLAHVRADRAALS